ncbi:MAG: tetratricopeptide repeat protein [Chloroflexi bacterium]|nr:tetratricopeptide repeat protein [Chloroflexota bacterium]
MEHSSLTDTQSRANLFQQGVLLNLDYWQTWLANKTADIAALDRERESIIRAISFALDLGSVAWPQVRGVIIAFSAYMERRGHWDIWNRVLRQAVAMAQHLGDVADELTLSLLFARLWQRQSRPTETILAYRRAIRLARCLGDEVSEARACSNLGYLYTEQGQWQRAEILCCHALTIFERRNNDHGRAHTENHLGLLYTRLGQWDKARHHLERACTLWQAMDDPHGVMRGVINLSLLALEMGNPAETLDYSTRALHQAPLPGEAAEPSQT